MSRWMRGFGCRQGDSSRCAGRNRLRGRTTRQVPRPLAFSQPLLKGFGVSVDTAPLRLARLADEINVLAFREAIAGVVTSTIRAWRDLVRARRQLEIGESSLERARKQREINRTLIEAGQMAAREILQSEANIADRELALVQSRNRVTASNFGLIDILDIDGATEVRPLETPAARPAGSVAGRRHRRGSAPRARPRAGAAGQGDRGDRSGGGGERDALGTCLWMPRRRGTRAGAARRRTMRLACG